MGVNDQGVTKPRASEAMDENERASSHVICGNVGRLQTAHGTRVTHRRDARLERKFAPLALASRRLVCCRPDLPGCRLRRAALPPMRSLDELDPLLVG